MLQLADAFAKGWDPVITTMLIFSMGTVDVGALPLSAWLVLVVQRRRCRVKDWPYLQAAVAMVCYLFG